MCDDFTVDLDIYRIQKCRLDTKASSARFWRARIYVSGSVSSTCFDHPPGPRYAGASMQIVRSNTSIRQVARLSSFWYRRSCRPAGAHGGGSDGKGLWDYCSGGWQHHERIRELVRSGTRLEWRNSAKDVSNYRCSSLPCDMKCVRLASFKIMRALPPLITLMRFWSK